MTEGGAATRAGHMTVADFLAFDDGTDTRHELVDGVPVAMNLSAGRHVFITSNVYDTLMAKLPRPCRPLFGGGVAHSHEDDQYRVPDVFVSCTPVPDSYFAEPRLMVEVLSPSTAREDRTAKLDFYKTLASAQAILFVWQDTRRVELHHRREDGWLVTDTIGQGTIALPTLGVELTLDEIYAGL